MSSNVEFHTLLPRDENVSNIVFNAVGQNTLLTNQAGAFIGNGKVGIITDFESIDVQKTMITTDIKYSSGVYKTNIIEPFYTNKIMFLENYNQTNKIQSETILQNANLNTATFQASFEIKNTDTIEQVNVEMSMYCPYHLPFCVIQTLDITPIRPLDIESILMNVPIYHEVYTRNNLTNITFNNNFISVEGTSGLYILSGSGIDSTTNKIVAFASAYRFEYPDTYLEKAVNLGFNIYRYQKETSCNSFMIPNLTLNTTVKMQIITAHMTDADFENPVEEVKRIVLVNIMNLAKVRNDHVNLWGNRWTSNMEIIAKPGITLELDNDIIAINQLIKVAYYNIYASTRENINTEINPLNLYVIDREGSLLYEGDLWLIPLLTIIKPDTARALLEQRYKTIEMAQQISGGYGYKGAKYPYSNDILGYKHMVYYDTKSPIALFNNALIALNVWNYYRITKDYDWLQSKGFAIMKNIANFFVSIIKYDSDTNTYNLENVSSLSLDSSQMNNSFTNNMIKLAFKYTTEACYELNLKPLDKWMQYHNGLPMLYINPDDFNDIIKVEQNSTENNEYFILDILFILVPYYSELYFTSTDTNHNTMSLKRNLEYYKEKIQNKYINHPYNTALLAIVYGMYAQMEEKYINTFDYYLHKFINDMIINNEESGSVNIWLNMKAYGKSTFNSLTTNAILLLMIMQALPQIHISGGVSSSKFYYEEMKESVRKSAIMPYHWNTIKIDNIGDPDNLKSYIVKNQAMFACQVACTEPAPL